MKAGQEAYNHQAHEVSASVFRFRIKEIVIKNAVILVPGLLFFVLLVAMNWPLFVTPLIESGDVAVNALQVQNAKHGHELLGNYSRWGFHHPGPVFFYVFGAGEAIFYDLLHVVPAPLNGEYLAEMALSTLCLFTGIHIFYVNVEASFFPAIAILGSVLFLAVLDTAIPGSALVSLWPPYMALFCFFLFVVACASVAAGNWNHCPILALAGMAMVHAHVSQVFFVTVLSAAALSTAAYRERRRGTARPMLRKYRYHITIAMCLVLLFLLPIALDWVLHDPDNITAVRAYLREHRGEHNSVKVSLLYVCSFFTFQVLPEKVLAKNGATLGDLLRPEWFIRAYWCAVLSVGVATFVYRIGRFRRAPVFVKYVLAEIALILVLFIYWSWRITGPMYTFNGYFFFSVQLLALLGCLALLTDGIRVELTRRGQMVISCAATVPLLLVSGAVNNVPTEAATAPVIEALRAKHLKKIVLSMPMTYKGLMSGAGIASYWQRDGGYFCVAPAWRAVFGAAKVCGNDNGYYHVRLSETAPFCVEPCSLFYDYDGLYVTGRPAHHKAVLKEPALVSIKDDGENAVGFYNAESEGVWSGRTGSLTFEIDARNDDLSPCALSISGTMLAGRSVDVAVNGVAVGRIETIGRTTQTFMVDPRRILWKGRNTVTFRVPNAGPVGIDQRQLGFMFEYLVLRVDRLAKDTTPSKAIVMIPPNESGDPIRGISWQAEGGWKPGGFYPGIGPSPSGDAWGSWSGNDSLTGQLTSSSFVPNSAGCVVVPVGHGPSVSKQRVSVVTTTGSLVSELPLGSVGGEWQMLKVFYNRELKDIRILAADQGTGFGEWVAVGQPRNCGAEQIHP